MRPPSAGLVIALVVAGALACGCAHTPGPDRWLPGSEASLTDAFGGWITAEVGSERKTVRVEGELIAIEPESLLVLHGDRPMMLAKSAIVKARVAGYDIDPDRLRTWAAIGGLSTLSHGVVLLISLPVWTLAGAIATSSAVHATLVEYPDKPWGELAKYARFPQGLPPGVEIGALRPKPR